MLSTRHINVKSCCNPSQWVQPINSSTNIQNSQGQYITDLYTRCFINDISNEAINENYRQIRCTQIRFHLLSGDKTTQSRRNYNLVTITKSRHCNFK